MDNQAIWNSAKRLYEAIWAYYMFQVSCITPEDYAHMQKEIGYKESYAQHMKQLVQGIPNDSRVMVQCIAQFLAEYVEFQDAKYCEKIEELVEVIHANREVYKRRAFEILCAQCAKQKEENAENVENVENAENVENGENVGHPALFELDLGGKKIVLPTYCNPMMTALYSRLFVCFLHFQKNATL